MARSSPIRRRHVEAEAALAAYGPPGQAVDLVSTFGELELEYAAIRKACILLDEPHRGFIRVRGADRVGFLNRMITQDLKGIEPGQCRRAFWLGRTGRIEADLRVLHLADSTLLCLDCHAVDRTMKSLSGYIVTEDVTLTDETDRLHALSLHGPTSIDLLSILAPPAAAFADLKEDRFVSADIAGHEALIDREDQAGEIGLHLVVPVDAVATIYDRLVETGSPEDPDAPALGGSPGTAQRIRLRPSGWHAFNIARIEAGTPLYNIDFGPDSLPHETGVLHDRVSFTKGCYLGQEVVARMQSRGQARRALVALRLRPGTAPADRPLQPETGAPVIPVDDPESDPVGVVTSSAISPMLGSAPICFAAVKPAVSAPGTELLVMAADQAMHATVQPRLRFWAR